MLDTPANRPVNTVVWSEIPVLDLDRAMAFYSTVFGFQMRKDESGPNPMAMMTSMDDEGCSGHLYPGKPAAAGNGPTIHMAIPDTLEAAAERCWKAGGTVQGEPITIPFGRFQYVIDPDGNSIGMFEAAKG